jgi:hypothetical protein
MKTVHPYELAIGDFIADDEFGALVVADQPVLGDDEITLRLETPTRSLGCTRTLAPEDTVTRYDDEDDLPEPKERSTSEGESGETEQPELTLERVAEAHDDLALYVAQLRAVAEQSDYNLSDGIETLRDGLLRTVDVMGDLARAVEQQETRIRLLEAQNAHIYDVLDAITTVDPLAKMDKALAIFERTTNGHYSA